MADKISLSDYMPSPSTIDTARIVQNREVGRIFLKSFWPELDTRPNSVFGDTMLTPWATLMAALEIAHERRESDLNLTNLASGIVYNNDFALKFLASLGATSRGTVDTTGVIRMMFTSNKQYVIDPASIITFNGDNYSFSTDEGDPIVIQPVGTADARMVLTRIGESQYVTYFPVSGTPGGTVADGTEATHNISQSELTSVVAVGDFDSGLLEEDVPALARKANQVFYSASLTTRGGAINFVRQQFPAIPGVSAVITGDTEMLRDMTNPMGIREGKLDLFVKSRTAYSPSEQVITLTLDTELDGWVGKLSFPQPPAFYDLNLGIFKVTNFDNEGSVNTVYAKSEDPRVDNVGVSFSNLETLGVLVQDTSPQNFQNHIISSITNASNNSASMSVEGVYASSVFSNVYERSVSLTFQKIEIVEDETLGSVLAAVALAVDLNTLETTTVYFLPDNTSTPTIGQSRKDFEFDKLFRGLTLKINSAPGDFVAGDLIGTKFTFSFRGQTAEFSVNFLIDPVMTSVEGKLSDPENRPAGIDVLTRSFIPCYINQFIINCRVPSGTTLDFETAQSDIFQYVNGITYPAVFEESVIGTIMIAAGASGITSLVKSGTFYPSLASVFVAKDGTETIIPREVSTSLVPSVNDFGVGAKNVSYILDLGTITFNATTF